MTRVKKASVLTLAEKCKNILASNWQGNLNTIKADAAGSKGEIYTSEVKYFVRKGKPYIWIPEKDLHNVNTVIDERGSFAISSPLPRPLVKLLRSIKKQPSRIALTGDIIPLPDEKIHLAAQSLKGMISSEQQNVKQFSHAVSGLLSSCDLGSTSRSENLKELLDENEKYNVCRFNIRTEVKSRKFVSRGELVLYNSCTYVDGNGSKSDVQLEDIEASKAHSLSPYCMSLIHGVNKSDSRRKALILFCITLLNENAKDAFLLSLDQKGLDILGKVLGPTMQDGSREHHWKEFRITLKEEAMNVEHFCKQLVQMEEEALKQVSGFTGL